MKIINYLRNDKRTQMKQTNKQNIKTFTKWTCFGFTPFSANKYKFANNESNINIIKLQTAPHKSLHMYTVR